MSQVECIKCNGTGNLGYHKHIENGVCFACKGTGKTVPATCEKYSWGCPAADLESVPKDMELEKRRIQYFTKMTTEQFVKLSAQQRSNLATWAATNTFRRPEIANRFKTEFYTVWQAL
jgi:hypothetical protein